MAIIAVVAAGNMRCVLASGYSAVVTGSAGAQHLRVIYDDRGIPQVGAVTVLTDICRLYVGRALAGRFDSVMAARATRGYVRMIKNSGDPGYGLVAVVALFAGLDVTRMFAG